MSFFFSRALAFLLLILLVSCNTQLKSTHSELSDDSDAEFQKGYLVENGIDSLKIVSMENAIKKGAYPNIHSVLLLKNGQLVFEKYFKGEDEEWGEALGIIEHHQDSLHDVRSISKSVVAACTGIALQQGKIDSVTQSIFDFFPEYVEYNTGQRAQITVETLLTMTTGMEWNENIPYSDPENSEMQMTSAEDPIAFVLSRPIVKTPGEVWSYNGGTTQLLATIIEKVSGEDIHQFAMNHLFSPMGIEKSEWTNFPNTKNPAAASGLRLRSRDLMKFGMVYANDGHFEGRQILPEEWVEKSKQSQVTFGRNNNVGYGYQFWIFKASTIADNQNHLIPTAVGNGDQRIYIDETNDMIVVVTAGNYNKWDIKKDSEALLTDFIYPALIP